MKPVMASVKAKFGDRVSYHYHEFYNPQTAQVNRDFNIQAHPEVFILDPKGNLVRRFQGVTDEGDIVAALQPLLGP